MRIVYMLFVITGLTYLVWAYDPYPQLQTPPSSSEWNEVAWSSKLSTEVGGEAEYRLPNGSRVDILTDDVAWEVEWADKYTQAVGQSIFYAISTDRDPGIWLLMRPGTDEKYLECLVVVSKLRDHGIPMRLRVQKVPSKK